MIALRPLDVLGSYRATALERYTNWRFDSHHQPGENTK